jgi:hypothetical protein
MYCKSMSNYLLEALFAQNLVQKYLEEKQICLNEILKGWY